jgi:hypothetical protein
MKRVLLVEDNEKYVNVLTKALCANSKDGLRIFTTDLVLHAVEYLKHISTVDLIIVKNSVGGEAAAAQISNYLLESEKAIPMIILGPVDCDLPPLCSIVADPYAGWKDVVSSAGKLIQSTPTFTISDDQAAYSSIPLSYLKNIPKVPCDLYLKIRQNGGGYKYLKRVTEGESVLRGDIHEFQHLGLHSFHVEERVRRLFINNAISEAISSLEKCDNEITDLLQTLETSYQLISGEVVKFGFIDDLADMLAPMLKYLERILTHDKLKKRIVKLVLEMDLDSSFKRAVLTHFACITMVDASEWGNAAQREKLVYTSYLHDISLKDDWRLLPIMTDEQLEESISDKAIKNLVKRHAAFSAMLAQQYPNLPSGVDRIIREHHGTPSGEGFAQELTNGISALAIVFIVGERFATELLETYAADSRLDVAEFFELLYGQFPQKAAHNLVNHLQENISI